MQSPVPPAEVVVEIGDGQETVGMARIGTEIEPVAVQPYELVTVTVKSTEPVAPAVYVTVLVVPPPVMVPLAMLQA
jgi:hypothetical protein